MEATLDQEEIRLCLEGMLPATIATCDADGTPNITYLSKVFYIDTEHIALSNQFFSKTVANIRVNSAAQLTLMHPTTARHYRFAIEYERSLSEGELFENARAEIDALASLMGKEEVFALRALDVYRVGAGYGVPCSLDTDGE